MNPCSRLLPKPEAPSVGGGGASSVSARKIPAQPLKLYEPTLPYDTPT